MLVSRPGDDSYIHGAMAARSNITLTNARTPPVTREKELEAYIYESGLNGFPRKPCTAPHAMTTAARSKKLLRIRSPRG
jgi:hypothetical protein